MNFYTVTAVIYFETYNFLVNKKESVLDRNVNTLLSDNTIIKYAIIYGNKLRLKKKKNYHHRQPIRYSLIGYFLIFFFQPWKTAKKIDAK